MMRHALHIPIVNIADQPSAHRKCARYRPYTGKLARRNPRKQPSYSIDCGAGCFPISRFPSAAHRSSIGTGIQSP
jgi:hypothetical protein